LPFYFLRFIFVLNMRFCEILDFEIQTVAVLSIDDVAMYILKD